MVKRPKIGLLSDATAQQILCLLHYELAHGASHYLYMSALMKALPHVSQGIIEQALLTLKSADYINQSEEHEPDAPYGNGTYSVYTISKEGIDVVEGWSDNNYDRISQNIKFPSVLEEDSSSLEVIDEDTWEPLALELTGSQYENAVSESEQALEEIRSHNGYSETEPNERDRIVWSLTEGLKHIKEGFPSRDQIQSMLVKPFSYIAEKFAGASLGEAAKAAVKALLEWI